MEWNDYLDPVSLDKPDENLISSENIIAKKISVHTQNYEFENLASYDVAILGLPEDRNSINKGAAEAPDEIRGHLYRLLYGPFNKKILDMGNLKRGNTYEDTCFALQEVLNTLIQNNIVLIILGGTDDLLLPIFTSLNNTKDFINLLTIDRSIGHKPDHQNSRFAFYLKEILENDSLFKYCNIGHQAYLTDQSVIEEINKSYNFLFRLGEVRSDITAMEPSFRDSDIIGFNINSIRSSDAMGYVYPTPNGFYADEACLLSRYAGLSDTVSVFGLFNTNPRYDNRSQTAMTAAQMIWYFIEGLCLKRAEYPSEENSNFKTFVIGQKDLGYEVVFYKSIISERWWLSIKDKNNEHVIVPCSYSDYLTACNHDVPNVLWKLSRKLV